MYPIPQFAGSASAGSFSGGGGSSSLVNKGVMDFGTSGQNQYMNYPSMTSNTYPMPGALGPGSSGGGGLNPYLYGSNTQQNNYPPGIVPPSGTPAGGNPNLNPFDTYNAGVGGKLPGGAFTGRTIDPGLTESLAQYLMSQLGQGMTPFDLQALLPSGGTTAPGTLTAPENPLMQSLNQFYTTGTGGPLPGVLPMWQSEMQSMNIPIQQQLANIKEQFGARGALGSSEMATALENFGTQTAADQEFLLGQLTLQALPGMQSEAGATQALDQQSISNLYQEFLRTQSQNNPLLQMIYGMGTEYAPIYGKSGFDASFGSTLGSTLGGAAGGAAAGGLGGILNLLGLG